MTLEDAKRKAVQEHCEILNAGLKTVDFIQGRRNKPQGSRKPSQVSKTHSTHSAKTSCTRCGKGPHTRQMCPAKEAVCHRCKKKGHFKSQCLSRIAGEVVSSISTATNEQYKPTCDDVAYLNSVNGDPSGGAWECSVTVNGVPTRFKLDTGAEVTVITEEAAKGLTIEHQMEKSTKKLFGADRRELRLAGGSSMYIRIRKQNDPAGGIRGETAKSKPAWLTSYRKAGSN